VNRLVLALVAYVVLGVLAWTTISDQRFRLVTLFVLAMFALKTWVRRSEVLHPENESEGGSREEGVTES
jgi:hypothetical protein